MASIRPRTRKDNSAYFAVLFRHGGKQTSKSFHDFASATKFSKLVDQIGPAKALETIEAVLDNGLTVEQWLDRYVDHLTGVEKATVSKYRAYSANDIVPMLGALPLSALSRDDVAGWVKGMTGSSGKTIANKHGFLSGALNAAVKAGRIPGNPAAGQRLPRTQKKAEMRCLSQEEFATLLAAITEPWRPLVEFLVASGLRWGEATALRPSDIDRDAGTVKVTRAWKPTKGGYEMGVPKTPRSIRSVDVPKSVLKKLDYSHSLLFVNQAGRPVRSNGFHSRVWRPALERVWPTTDADGKPLPPEQLPLRPRVHDLRHTCASWMIQSGVLLPVVQAHLGHESINTTIQLYTHLDRKSMSTAASAIGAMLKPEQTSIAAL